MIDVSEVTDPEEQKKKEKKKKKCIFALEIKASN